MSTDPWKSFRTNRMGLIVFFCLFFSSPPFPLYPIKHYYFCIRTDCPERDQREKRRLPELENFSSQPFTSHFPSFFSPWSCSWKARPFLLGCHKPEIRSKCSASQADHPAVTASRYWSTTNGKVHQPAENTGARTLTRPSHKAIGAEGGWRQEGEQMGGGWLGGTRQREMLTWQMCWL